MAGTEFVGTALNGRRRQERNREKPKTYTWLVACVFPSCLFCLHYSYSSSPRNLVVVWQNYVGRRRQGVLKPRLFPLLQTLPIRFHSSGRLWGSWPVWKANSFWSNCCLRKGWQIAHKSWVLFPNVAFLQQKVLNSNEASPHLMGRFVPWHRCLLMPCRLLHILHMCAPLDRMNSSVVLFLLPGDREMRQMKTQESCYKIAINSSFVYLFTTHSTLQGLGLYLILFRCTSL